jgi:hypothetical protein
VVLRAVLTPGEQGHRIVNIETERLAKDLMLALRLETVSSARPAGVAKIRADIGLTACPRGRRSHSDGRGHLVISTSP